MTAVGATVGRRRLVSSEAHRGSGSTGGTAQRRTAKRERVRGLDIGGGRKAATLALEMEIVAHAAGGFNDGEV